VLFYELLTGAPPFRGDNAEATRTAHKYTELPLLPPELASWRVVLEGCLAKFPEDRFPSMSAVRAALGAMSSSPEATPLIEPSEVLLDDDEPVVVQGTLEGLAPGTYLGAYEILGVLGEGGMGRVYSAEHRTLGRKVAIKVLRDDLGSGAAMTKRFVQEAQAVNRVHHPNIVQIFDLVQEPVEAGGRTWFVMELLEGQSLKSLGRETPVVLPRTVRYLRQAAEALAAAHAVGVIHRDLKPDNLFVTGDVLKVLDFGVAQVRDLNKSIPRTTQVGQVVGTPLWMAPEQILGKEIDSRADVYGLATVLYVMITRRFPFDGVAMADVVMQRLQKEARPAGKFTFLGEEIPAELTRLLTECLSREVSGRPQMAQVASRLAAVERELAASAQGTLEGVKPAAPRRWVTWVLGGLLALSAGALAWMQFHH
jgi:serine/threonine-protein kinase